MTWGYNTERPGKGLPLARPQGTEEKGTACMLEKPVPFLQNALAQNPPPPPQKGCRKGVPAHKGCAERVQKGGSSAEKGGAPRVHKGCTKGVEPPFQQEGGVWKIRENGPFQTKVKISHQKGRKHVVIGPEPLFNHTRW